MSGTNQGPPEPQLAMIAVASGPMSAPNGLHGGNPAPRQDRPKSPKSEGHGTENVGMQSKNQCPGRDLNPHSDYSPGDFKSPVSANSTTWAGAADRWTFDILSSVLLVPSLRPGQVKCSH